MFNRYYYDIADMLYHVPSHCYHVVNILEFARHSYNAANMRGCCCQLSCLSFPMQFARIFVYVVVVF